MEQHDIVKMLQVYGFEGLHLISFDPETNTSNYKFGDCDVKKLHVLGEATVTSNGKVGVYKIGDQGKLGFCPSKNLVRFIYKGKARDNTTAYDAKGARIPTTPDIEQAFYKAQAASGKQRAFVKKVWDWANGHFFSARLTPPSIIVDTTCTFAPKLKNAYGVFQYNRSTKLGRMFIHTKCFKATEQITVGTIIHEMCHQATHEIDHITVQQSMVEKGHGPEWKKWMVHCNLEPNRYAYEDLAEYGDSTDRIAKVEKLSNLVGPRIKPDDLKGLKPVATHALVPNQIIMFDYKGHLARGYISSTNTPHTFNALNKRGEVSGYFSLANPEQYKFFLAPSQEKALK